MSYIDQLVKAIVANVRVATKEEEIELLNKVTATLCQLYVSTSDLNRKAEFDNLIKQVDNISYKLNSL